MGQAGATVYITGRSTNKLQECSEEIKKRGGQAIPIQVDHSNDSSVQELFERINKDQSGRLDILVNNAYAGVDTIMKNAGKKFHAIPDPAEHWDCINGVGLRNHYLCTVYASRMMVARKDGLIVNISSIGGLKYLFNVAYGIGKAGKDRMAADCAQELKKDNVTMVSLWPGAVKTEYIQENILDSSKSRPSSVRIFKDAESVEFAGKAVVKLAEDPERKSKTGKILLVCDLAKEYGFTDDDGEIHDMRSLKYVLASQGHKMLPLLVPGFVRIPLVFLHLAGNKF